MALPTDFGNDFRLDEPHIDASHDHGLWLSPTLQPLQSSNDAINLETKPEEHQVEVNNGIETYLADVDFQQPIHRANDSVDAQQGVGGGFLQHSHWTGYPHESLSVRTSPAPNPAHSQLSSIGSEHVNTEPFNDIQNGVVADFMGGVNRFNNEFFSGSIGAPLVQANGLVMEPLYGENAVTSSLTQPALQPIINTSSFPFGPVNPIQQRTPCPWNGCRESFVRSSDIQRHWDSVHLGIKHHCSWIGCPNNGGKGYCRLEKLRTHQRQKHGYTWV